MEDNISEGPSAVWHMFNAPTMVLFNNLEQAADGLERIISSILKLTGDFSEVLVSRPGSSSYPESHFQAFNTWLIGRLFYVLSVKELTGIHNQSKEAQIKILNVLAVNHTSFHEKILFEYIDILHNLIQYYKVNANEQNSQRIILKNFASENVEVPNVQLNFTPIFVNITNIENCELIIEFTLQILSQTIPIKTIEESKNKNLLKNLFKEVLSMLEQFNMKLKIISLKFFCDIIELIEKITVINFNEYFCEEFNSLILLCEAMTSNLALYYEKGEIKNEFAEQYSTLMIRLLKILKLTNDIQHKDVILSISSIILDEKNSKIFNKKLKEQAMSNISLVNFSKDLLKLELKDYKEIEILSEYFISNMLKDFEQNPAKIQESWYFKQLKSVMDGFDNTNIDTLLLTHHLKIFSSVMNMFISMTIAQDKFKSIFNEYVSHNESQIINNFETVTAKYKEVIFTCIENTEVVLNIMITLAYLKQDINVITENNMIQYIIFHTKSSLNNKDVKVIVLRYVLAGHMLMKTELSKIWINKVLEIITALTRNKNDECYRMVISLTPFLLHSKTMFQSKIIADILMPAFLTKDTTLQTEVTCILPSLTCMSFGDYSVTLNTKKTKGDTLITNENWCITICCKKCHKNEEEKNINKFVIEEKYNSVINDSTIGQRSLFVKFLNVKTYADIKIDVFTKIVNRYSNHTVFDAASTQSLFCGYNCDVVLKAVPSFIDNVWADKNLDESLKETMLNTSINILVQSTRKSLGTNDWNQQSETLDIIKKSGLLPIKNVLLPTTKLLVYFIMHPQCTLGPKALIYLRDICENHKSTPNQVYHRYKKDYCKLFVDCSLHNGKEFAVALLKVVRAFGFVGYRDFISKDVHHFLPFLITYCGKLTQIPSIIQEIASLIQCSVSDFIIERFPHVYTYVYLYQNEQTSKKCYELIEKTSKTSILDLIKRHFRVILTEFLLQYCCNPDKVINACKYLACHDPDVSIPNASMNMTTSQIADFLNPKFLGVLAYFDHKLVNAKVALSVKRKALQSFPDIMKLMGSKYLTPLRFKVLATLRSALTLAEEFPKIVAAAWSAFIHNIDSMCLGPLLSNLAVSLLQQFDHAPHEINKTFQFLVLNNENLLSSHISDLFFVEDSKIAEKIKVVIRKHVKRTQPEVFLDKIKWYLHHLNQDIAMIKAYAFTKIDELLKNNRSELHRAIFGGKNIDPVIVELIDQILSGCKDPDPIVSISSGACFGQLGAIDSGRLPRQYVQTDRNQFAFSLNDDCFAATALQELCRAFQYEKDTTNMDCYALTIQEILKIYNISPTGTNKCVWDAFPEHLHQIMYPLLTSRYTLAYPSQPKKTHPLFGSVHASNFLEWAHIWAGQLISVISSESIRELLRTVHPSMRRDVRTLLLFLPYVLLHAVMTSANIQYVYQEIMAVIGLENFEAHKKTATEQTNKYKLLRHVRLTPCVATVQTDDGIQVKCSKIVYTLFDFLNRWLLEWCHSKQHPLQNDNYKAISQFVNKFDKLTIARGNFACGEYERALQYLEMYMEEDRDRLQPELTFLAQIYAVLEEPDNVAGILSLKRSEPSLRELVLTQMVTGRVQDAALCYRQLAQQGPLDVHSLQGMMECYLSLDEPTSALSLLEEMAPEVQVELAHMSAEPLWRLQRFDQLQELVDNTPPSPRDNWGLLMGRILTSYRRLPHSQFPAACETGIATLLSHIHYETKGDSALRTHYQSVLGLHVVAEARHVQDLFTRVSSYGDGDSESELAISQLLCDWRRRLCLVQSDVRTIEPVLRIRRTLLMQTQELLQTTHPMTADKIKSCIGDLWIQSAKYARKADIYQQSYMCVLNAEGYSPPSLFVSKCKLYWRRGQTDLALTTLRRGLGLLGGTDTLTTEQRKICAKAKLLIAKYNDETTNVDVDVNIGYYKEAVDACKHWEKSLVCLGAYYEKVSHGDSPNAGSVNWSRRVYALNSYGRALQQGHRYLYQSMPRMLSIWLDVEVTSADTNLQNILAQMTEIIKTYSEKLPLYLYLTAFSQIVSRICHPVKDVYLQLKAIIVKLIVAYPQHTLWNMMSVIKSGYPQRLKRCQDVFSDPRLKEPHILKLVADFTQLAEKLIDLCNKPIVGNSSSTTVSSLVRSLPRVLDSPSFSHILMPFEQFCKVELPPAAGGEGADRIPVHVPTDPPVYIAGIDDTVHILPSLQKPRKVTLKGSDGKSYIIMLKPRDDLRKDYRLMEFNAVVNRFLADAPESRALYIRTYCVLPLNEECGLIEWVPRLLGLRPILMHIYKQKGIHTSNRELKEMMCSNKDPVEKKRRIYEEQLLPRHPAVFQEWFRRVFSDPYGWYQARSAYIRTTAVMSMVGYILGLGDRHGENISFDSMNGDTVHVDFNCLFNKGEAFEWPERVPFRLTHNMEAAMGPLRHEGMFRKSCEVVMRVLRSQTVALMSVTGPFLYDPLVSWGTTRGRVESGERTNDQAHLHLKHIQQRLNGMVKTKNKQLSLSLSPEGQVEHLIVEATSVLNLCQMYIGWGPFL